MGRLRGISANGVGSLWGTDMYDFSGLWKNREKALTVGIIIAFLLLAVCWFSYCLGLRNAGSTDGDAGSGGAEQVGQHIQSAVTGQRERAQQELKQLQLQIATLKALSVNQENSLQKVNESFKQYAEEQKRTRLRIKAQRNTWEAVAACLVIALAVK